ncbi:MAG: nodulation protein NfeD [Chloroflexota bacterium]|nr:nodulation protein NfeD [Chloroflexota bacterium]
MYRRISKTLYLLIITLLALIILAPTQLTRGQADSTLVIHLTAEGAITPAMAEYLARGIEYAENEGAEVLIFQLDTPGGAIDTMNEMVKEIRASQVPVVAYIAPEGAMAASAGAVITLAGHASAMAPETTIGAASPVGGEGEDLGETMEAKQKNILKATVRSLTEERGPEAITLAEEMIESAEAVSASEALDAGLIDFIADDLDQLLEQLDGFTVTTTAGEVTLNTSGADVSLVSPSFIEQLLGILTNPNIVFLLLTIGVQAILIEISSPGGWVAGFIGVVCLALAAYGLGVLPVNWFGMIFLIIAFVLFILDIQAPTHGALTAAGVGSLIIGALVLFNSPSVPNFLRVSVPLVVGTSIATGLIFFVILMFGLRAQRTPIRTGRESLIGKVGVVRVDLKPVGLVQVGGERWTAEPLDRGDSIPRDTEVEIVQVDGLRIKVRRVE